VEINLNKKKGATFGSSRESSVEKTPLSYFKSELNVRLFLSSLAQELTTEMSCRNHPQGSKLATEITKD